MKDPNVGLDRRDFLKGTSALALTAGAGLVSSPNAMAFQSQISRHGKKKCHLPDKLLPHPKLSYKPQDKGWFWREVRSAFVLPKNYIHMNTGTTGSMPCFSMNNLAVYNLYKSLDPRDWSRNMNQQFPELFPLENGSATTARQIAIADMYGANPDEIVLSYNTTDACNLIFAGTPWKPGDRIITTHWEHPALIGPINWARDYHSVDVEIVGLPSNFDQSITIHDVLWMFEQKLMQPLGPDNKQYIAVSEIFYKNGLRLPIKEISELARKYGAYTIIDTAHGWGMLPINCHDYGVDFIAGAGHKWLCGGPGTGILYVRNSGDNLPPFNMGNWFLYGLASFTPSPAPQFDNRNWAPSFFMQFRGEINTPAIYAMTDSAAFWNYIGVDSIYRRGVRLANFLKRRIAQTWGNNALWVQRNPDPAFATCLTSFNPFVGKDSSASYDDLRTAISNVVNTLAQEDPKIYIRFTTFRDQPTDTADNRVGFRVSTHAVYNNYREINHMFDRLVAAVNATGLPQLS